MISECGACGIGVKTEAEFVLCKNCDEEMKKIINYIDSLDVNEIALEEQKTRDRRMTDKEFDLEMRDWDCNG